ncbi:MAG: hypothetical protein ACKVSF_15370 [Alphaproteobacteria bacterium]
MRAAARLVRAALVFSTLFWLGGCYELAESAIDLRDARELPWIEGEWVFGGRRVFVFAGDSAKEYRYREITGTNIATGTLRAVPLGAELFLVQAREDSGTIVALFYRLRPDGGADELEPNDRVAELARRFGVSIGDDIDPVLSGSRGDVRAFLLAHTWEHFHRPR